MDVYRWKQVEDLLQSALELPMEQQEDFLRRACGNPEMLHDVRSLLTAHRDASNILDTPVVNVAALMTDFPEFPPPSRFIPGQLISHYRLQDQVGEGGMGLIYQAEDIKLGRRVAMKFLPGEVASDRAALNRLQREACAASSLEHPNICPIYELGEHDGQPFIVMQLLEGKTLRAWIDDFPNVKADACLDQAIELAIQTANGLEAAHSKGIIHRDIKPANIFITTRGEAKILDFGLAKLLEDLTVAELSADTKQQAEALPNLNLTRTGATMGTPYYMSPEQVRGEKLDARTDLFSLGAVIYEMLTGRRAFAGATLAEIHEAILLTEPVTSGELRPDLPGALKRIISKALAKDRNTRYNSALEISKDLQKLRDRMRPTHGQRVTRARLLTIAVLFACLLISLILILPRTRQLSSGIASPTPKVRRSVAVLDFHNLSGGPAEEWITPALTEMMITELAAGSQLRIIPGENVEVIKSTWALPNTGRYGPASLAKMRRSLGADMVVQGSYAVSHSQLHVEVRVQEASDGDIIAVASQDGSDTQIAQLVSRVGATLRKQLNIAAAPDDDVAKASLTLPSDPRAARLYSEGIAKYRASDALGARELLKQSIALERTHALSHSLLSESLSSLGYDNQAQAQAKRAFELSRSLSRESQLLVEGRYRQLADDLPAAIEIYRTLWKFFPDDLEYGLKLVSAQNKASLTKDALITIEQLRKLPDPSGADPRIDLAEADTRDALGDFKRSQLSSAAAAVKAQSLGSRQLQAQATDKEGWAWERMGSFDRALASFSEARELAIAGGDFRMTATSTSGEAVALYDKGDFRGAITANERSLKLGRQIGSQRIISAGLGNIGAILFDQGKLAEARGYFQEGLSIERSIGDRRAAASTLGNLGTVMERLGDLPAATHMQEEVLQAFHDLGDIQNEGTCRLNLGSVLQMRGKLASAKAQFERAMALMEKAGERDARAYGLFGLAGILKEQNLLPEARSAALEALKLSRELKEESLASQVNAQLARILLAQGDTLDAEKLSRTASQSFLNQDANAQACKSNATLGRALLAQGKVNEATQVTDSALLACVHGEDVEARFEVEIANAIVQAQTGKLSSSISNLERLNAETARLGYFPYALESKLFLGQIQTHSGRTSSGRAKLKELQAEAHAAKFDLIARNAQAALSSGSFLF